MGADRTESHYSDFLLLIYEQERRKPGVRRHWGTHIYVYLKNILAGLLFINEFNINSLTKSCHKR